ncbi:UNVERIFIED_CONTAM: putative ribonuclease H protein [Sesamum latifolium]|uniref:Ribonuclease H protein n=1 Tax=Sesamum latifolium TaxID=2727402 RepID=A0AAW2WZ62_9LAMI
MVKEHLANLMGMRLEERHNKYLGLPTTVGRSKREVFQHVKEQVWVKLQDWQAKNLSQAGKVTLIKSVIQSIPTFVMSCFRLPINICGEIESMAADFFWNNKEKKRVHWLAWEKLCARKEDGGLGFRKLREFNTTLLAKQFWRIATNSDCLLSKVLKSKYFPETDVFEAQVGSGKDIHIWSDRWLPRLDTFRVLTAPHTLPMDATIAELLEDEDNGWNVELVSSIFIKEDVDCILSIPLPADRGRDVLRWHQEKNGRFSVRSAYPIALRQAVSGDQGCSLRSPGGCCPWCGKEQEDVYHALECSFARLTWAMSNCRWDSVKDFRGGPEDWVRGVHCNLDGEEFGIFMLICWFLWDARNRFVFEGQKIEALEVVSKARCYAESLTMDKRGAEVQDLAHRAFHGDGGPSARR